MIRIIPDMASFDCRGMPSKSGRITDLGIRNLLEPGRLIVALRIEYLSTIQLPVCFFPVFDLIQSVSHVCQEIY